VKNTIQIACQIGTTDSTAKLGLEIHLDGAVVFESNHVQDVVNFVHDMSDDDGEHELEFVMKNKTADNTRLDADGAIIKDANLTITDLAFDEIQLGYMFIEQATYAHNFNGTGQAVQDKFYGEMGCNGIVSLKFATPIYLWLLEQM
jgi:hypothetical protein